MVLPRLLCVSFLLLLLGHALSAVATPEADVDREIDATTTDPRLRVLGKVVAALLRMSGGGGDTNTTTTSSSSYYGDNDLWRGLFSRCGGSGAGVALSCVKKSVFAYLDGALSVSGDLAVTDALVFTSNGRVVENKYSRQANDDEDSDSDSARSSSFEEVTDALYDKGVDFLASHDLTLQLPETLFGGAVLRLSPRAVGKDGGALVTVEAPKQDAGDARIFFKKHKFFKKKLMMSFMALMMVIKMIKVKLMFLLPAILGVGTAKKLFLKVLLFLFPAFSHLFKFCSYYHGIHASKFHHHHHQIAHHHHHVPVPVPVHVPVHPPEHHHHVEHGPPPSYHSSGPGSSYHGGGPGPWESSGPGEEYVNRNDYLSAVVKHNEQELASWGIGADNYLDEQRISRSTVASTTKAPPPQQLSKLQQQQLLVQQQQMLLQQQQQLQLQQAQKLKLQQVLTPRPPTPGTTLSVMYDAFYSPILQRMDNVFVQLGFNEEACRERLVCSMYKRPQRFSPHSNLISAELSRDPEELSRPSSSNTASARFHRYVQAARDGQDQKDCLSIYPACTVNTEI